MSNKKIMLIRLIQMNTFYRPLLFLLKARAIILKAPYTRKGQNRKKEEKEQVKWKRRKFPCAVPVRILTGRPNRQAIHAD